MPDRTKLKVGDKIRLLRVPEGDLRQREQEIRDNAPDAGFTANVIERIIRQNPVVKIAEIDHGYRWFWRRLKEPDGSIHHHALAIVDDDSWIKVRTRKSKPGTRRKRH